MPTNPKWLLAVLVLISMHAIQPIESLQTLAYYFEDESLPSLQREIHRLDEVSFDSFTIDNRGFVRGATPHPGMEVARTNNQTKVFLCVNNFGQSDFDGPRIHRVLKSRKYRNRLINQLLVKVRKGYDGINIDFEAIPRQDRSRLTSFITQLAYRLHSRSLLLAISVPPSETNDPTDSWSGAFDYAKLGAAVDILQIMTYDQHGPWDPTPGPVAGLDWVKRCVQSALTVVPASKLSVGIPAYGYLWNMNTHKGDTIAWTDFSALIEGRQVLWDENSSSPHVKYSTAGGTNFEAWFENARSIKMKADYVRSIPNIHGVSVWALAHEDAAFWDALLNV